MKLFRSKIYITVLLLTGCVSTVKANDSTYQQNVERIKNRWSSLVPNYTKLQYAGSMGLISAGTGWNYGKNRQWETDIMLGFLPKFSTDHAKMTFTIKQNYMPWHVRLGKSDFVLEPLACGMYLNTVFDDDFWLREPKKYPGSGYYNFSTKVRFNLYLGQRITYEIPSEKRRYNNAMTFFYELSSNELYIISYFGNMRAMSVTDIFHLSLGLKFQFI